MLQKEMVMSALSDVIEDKELLNQFDTHSNINLCFSDGFSLNITEIDNEIWLWSRLEFINNHNISNNSYELLQLLMSARPHISTNSYAFLFDQHSGSYEIKAQLKPDTVMNEQAFHECINMMLMDIASLITLFK